MHLHILTGLQKLIKLNNPIIHNDLKDENILIDDIYDIPIIIDFGLSFTKDDVQKAISNPETLKRIFFSRKYYIPWTIEYILLAYIANDILSNQTKHINIHIDKVETYLPSISLVIDEFVTNNLVFIQQDDYKLTFINHMNTYIKSFRSKTLKELIEALFQNWKSWDNYAIAIIFYQFIVKNFSTEQDKYLKKYQHYLLEIILLPLHLLRPSPIDTYNFITSIIKY